MRRSKFTIIALFTLLSLTLTFSTGWNAKRLETDTIQLRGSGNLAPIAQKVAENFMQENPGSVVTVLSTGTMRGYKSLIDATSNVGMASAHCDESLKKRAQDNEMTIKEQVVALDALVPVVHPGNTVSNLTLEQLRKLFSGEITNWSQVGGADEPVIIVSHDGTSGNYETWKEKVIGEGKIVTPKAKIMASDAMRDYIQQTPGAIGYLGLSYHNSSLKFLSVDGIKAQPATIQNNTYPIIRTLSLCTTQHTTATINKFIEYFLAADKGQTLVRQAGVIPVKL
ncbi:MAG TPA: phosphate ABC transporter substrate-binding protein [Patescibacteria group bacterium]|nr:phosphate ABC transporter substrate-binding protein [Patescibacteria group bacterium]